MKNGLAPAAETAGQRMIDDLGQDLDGFNRMLARAQEAARQIEASDLSSEQKAQHMEAALELIQGR